MGAWRGWEAWGGTGGAARSVEEVMSGGTHDDEVEHAATGDRTVDDTLHVRLDKQDPDNELLTVPPPTAIARQSV